MTWPVSETLRWIAPHVPPELVSPATFERIQSQARLMPSHWSSFYMECRLGAGEQQVDFLAAVGVEARDEHRLGAVRGASEVDRLALHCRERSAWDPWHSLCAEWSDPQSVLSSQVPALWVELDGLNEGSTNVPSVCVCVARNYLRRTGLSENREARLRACQRALEILAPAASSLGLLACLGHVLEQLEPGGELIHLSVMLGRNPAAIKLYVSLPATRLRPFLDGTVPHADKDQLLEWVQCAGVPTNPVYLDLTLSDQVSERVGFALSQLHLKNSKGSSPGWDLVLDWCVRAEACCTPKRRALRSWVDRERLTYAGEAWPVHLERFLDVKLVSAPGKPLEAKAYLGFQPRAGFL